VEWVQLERNRSGGFTLIEVVIALGLLSLLLLAALGLSSVVDKSNVTISDRVEAEHSGQATLDYIVRELQMASAFYFAQATTTSIGYRRTFNAQNTYWRLSVGANQRLYRTEFTGSDFATVKNSDVISDGITALNLEYSVDGTAATKVVPPDMDPKLFYVILVNFSVTCRSSTVALKSAVSTLNIKGQEDTDINTGLGTGEVI